VFKLKPKLEKPVTGLPVSRKRPQAFGTPTVEEFLAAISRHRGTNRNPRVGRSRIGK
jgi:hypothetical protein